MLTAATEHVYLSLSQAARRFPPTKTDRPVHVSTLTRWIVKGARAVDGTRIKLEARRFPCGWKVTDRAIERFLNRLTAAVLDQSEPDGTRAIPPSDQRQMELEQRAHESEQIWPMTEPNHESPCRRP